MKGKWNIHERDAAALKWQFVVVTPIGLDRVNIMDIKDIWTIYPEIVFSIEHRILGILQDIVKELENKGVDKRNIYQYISKTNYKTFKSVHYNNEIENYNTWRQFTITNYSTAKNKSLSDLLVLLNPHMKPNHNANKVSKVSDILKIPKINDELEIVSKINNDKIKILPPIPPYRYTFMMPDRDNFKKMSIEQIIKLMLLLNLKDSDYVGTGKNGSLLRKDRINILIEFWEKYGFNIIHIDRPIGGSHHSSYRNL